MWASTGEDGAVNAQIGMAERYPELFDGLSDFEVNDIAAGIDNSVLESYS